MAAKYMLIYCLLAARLADCILPDLESPQIEFPDAFWPGAVLLYGDAYIDEDSLYGTLAQPFSNGLVLYPSKVFAHDGFRIRFNWHSACLPAHLDSEDEGVALVFLKELPSNTQIQGTRGCFGMGNIPEAYVIAYSPSYNSILVCHWNESVSATQASSALRNHCQVIPITDAPPIPCNNEPIDWLFFNDRLFFRFPDNNNFSIGFNMDPAEYYFGLSFSNGNRSLSHRLTSLYYKYAHYPCKTEYTLNLTTTSERFTYYGFAFANDDGTIRLVKNNPRLFGVAVSDFRWNLANGFVTKYIWSLSQCNSPYVGGEGFAFFFTKIKPVEHVGDVGTYRFGNSLGVATIPHIPLAVAYSTTYNRFYVCNWTNPIMQFNNGDTPSCITVPNPMPRLTCSKSHTFVLYYNDSVLNLYVNNYHVLELPDYAIDNEEYFVGFSGSSGQDFFYRQDITYWQMQTVLNHTILGNFIPADTPIDVSVLDPPVSPPIIIEAPITPPVCVQPPTPIQCPCETAQPSSHSSNFVFLGNAANVGKSIRLNGGAGLVYSTQTLNGTLAFETRFTWTPIDCDPVYNGADGWSFFLTKNTPTLEQVQNSPGGGLGIQNVPNTIMAAYSATFNEFWVANWTQPLNYFRWHVATVAVTGPKYTCGGSFEFSVSFSHPLLTVRLNDEVVISTQVDLDRTMPYYFGLSGGTGGGYFQQDFTDWSITLPSSLL